MTTRHGSRDGTPEDFGCIYFEMDESNHIRRDLAPDEVKAALDAHMERVGKAAEEPAPEAGWSEWMNWAGGECPLPPDTGVECETANGDKTPEGRCVEARWWEWERRDSGSDIARFRYREDAPGGWVERGDFIPPESLFDEASPVRCEWTYGLPVKFGGASRPDLGQWNHITHIRLLPRSKPEPEMPEGWSIGDGTLIEPGGVPIIWSEIFEACGPDTIRAAVEAWLMEMERR